MGPRPRVARSGTAARAPRRDYLPRSRPPPRPGRSAPRSRVSLAPNGTSASRHREVPPAALGLGEAVGPPTGDYFLRGGIVRKASCLCVMASRSGARALSVGVAPGCACHVTRRRKRLRRLLAGAGAGSAALGPAAPLPARPGPAAYASHPNPRRAERGRYGTAPRRVPPTGRLHPDRYRAAPALRPPYCRPR